MPESFKNFIEITSLGVDKHIKFVIGSFSSCSLAPNEDVKIYLLDNDGNYGYICAKNDEGNIEEYPFYGDAMIYAAIFGDQFGCLHEVLVEKLKIMSSVYDKKIDSIGSSKCTLIYNEMKLSLANLANLENNLIGFKNAVGVVESKNKELIANGYEPVF